MFIVDARRELAELLAAFGDGLGHFAEDVHAAFGLTSATFMISSVMPSILMSICRAVMPLAVRQP
jgi:hypothetical protein